MTRFSRRLPVFIAIISAAITWTHDAAAQRNLTEIPVPDPAEELGAMIVAEGFEVNLFAANPMLAKPIQMNFDADGRLWIVSSEVYPHILPGQTANDKVLVLEDEDGDGEADKTTVFADGLLIPTGIEPGDGGAYVANSTELLHLGDNDGDGKADTTRVVLSGFGTEDTHHLLHTLRWGHDGNLYFHQSIYIHSHIETPHGVKRLNGGGVWRFRPETYQLDVFMRGLVNSWGHHVDPWGQSFVTDGAGGEGINYVVPGAYYFTAVGAKRILHGLNPGSPKYCGLEIVSGRHLPDSWQGNALTNDFRANRICRFVLEEDGTAYRSIQQEDVIRSTNVAFRPIDVKMGPDGAIYVADWYNPIIQHGEVDFRDPRRDQVHGRIWRITAKGRPLVPRPEIRGADDAELLERLREPEEFTRRLAKREMCERGAARMQAPLDNWLAMLDPEHADYEQLRLEGLWCYQSLDLRNVELLDALMVATDHRVRAAAVRVAAAWADEFDDPLKRLAVAARDDHPRVRMEAVRALSDRRELAAVSAALSAAELPRDDWLDYALWLTAEETQALWVPALAEGSFDFDGNDAALLFALENVPAPEAVGRLVELIRDGDLAAEREARLLAMVAKVGGAPELDLVFATAVEDRLDDGRRERLLEALLSAAERDVRPSGDVARLGDFLGDENVRVASSALRLAGVWRIESFRNAVTEAATDSERSPAVRTAAVEALGGYGGDDTVERLTQLTDIQIPAAVRHAAVRALAGIDVGKAAAAGARLMSDGSEGDAAAVVGTLLARKQGAEALAKVLGLVRLPADVAKIAVRTARSSGRDVGTLTAALERAGQLDAGANSFTADDVAAITREVATAGDARLGEQIYRRQQLACVKCHAIAGAGGAVGPDLLSIGASAPADYLVESILLPNKAVKENYHAVSVLTDEGKIYSGIPVRRSGEELVLRDAENQLQIIAIDTIEEEEEAASLMPAGLANELTRSELVHLASFLTRLGKPGEFSVGTTAVVRNWEVLIPSRESMETLRFSSIETLPVDHPSYSWEGFTSRVDGGLPLAEVRERIYSGARMPSPWRTEALVRFTFETDASGHATLELAEGSVSSVWIDGARREPAERIDVATTPGSHTASLLVRLEGEESLRVVLDGAGREESTTAGR